MAIVIEANYSKKVGLPQYSSHQYCVTLRTEINDLSQAETESARLYALLQTSSARLPLLQSTGTKLLPRVVISGGADQLDKILTRDWPGQWSFRFNTDATMQGLGRLTPRLQSPSRLRLQRDLVRG